VLEGWGACRSLDSTIYYFERGISVIETSRVDLLPYKRHDQLQFFA
jgi:hypothetical protein